METETGGGTSRLWDRSRQAAMTEIYDTAVRLFTEHGFEGTTIDQIAREVGISRRSFFRYFGTKEDIVCGDLESMGRDLAAALEAQPAGSSPWQALRETFVTTYPAHEPPQALTVYRLMRETPSLRARHLEKRLRWQDRLVPLVAARLGGGPGAALRATALVSSAIACTDAALDAWLAAGGDADLVALYDEAVAAIRA